jgi:hypothetical protein
MKFWIYRTKKGNQTQKKNFFFKFDNFDKVLAFKVFNDLCVTRKWKKLKIVTHKSLLGFLVIGIIPNTNGINNSLEIFLPMSFAVSSICIDGLFDLNNFRNILKFFTKNFTFNLALIDYDSSIAYYKISDNIKKSIGPFV